MERQTIGQLVEGALKELQKQSYASITTKHYEQAFARFTRYAAKVNEPFLSEKLFERFMCEIYGWDASAGGKTTAHITSQLRVLRILKVFEDVGLIPGRVVHPKEPPDCFRVHYDLYMAECIDRGLSDKTIVNRSLDICGMLIHAKSKGFTNITQIDMMFLDEHLLARSSEAPKSMSRILSSIRCFLRCMFSNKFISSDLSFIMPLRSRYPAKPVQKLWTSEEVNQFLGSVDRSDAKGKRDYAIILLVVRYGIRAGDILNLKMTDINWDTMTIQFCQSKTSVSNALPILDDIGWALADWISNARPKQASTKHVFTRLAAPYCEMKSLGDIFTRRMTMARITRVGCGKAGPHSLRHALASHMLAGQVPRTVITSVLGHVSPESTTVYLHSDIEGLRQCAIDCPDEEGKS